MSQAVFNQSHSLSLMASEDINTIRGVLASEGLSILEDDPGVLTVVFDTAGEAARVADAVAGAGGANGPNVCSSNAHNPISHLHNHHLRLHTTHLSPPRNTRICS